MASRHEVLCIHKTDRSNPHERITHIGGRNGDGTAWKITQEEAMNYARSMWKTMAAGRKTIPVQEAAEDFARGNMKLDAQSMDTKHEGTISESEFMSAVQHRFNKMKDPNGTMTVVGAAQAFSRGNQSVASESAHSVER